MKTFFKNIHSLPAGLSYKLTNQVASYTQSANSRTLSRTLPGCEMSHLIGQHSAVHLRPPPHIRLQGFSIPNFSQEVYL